MKLGYSLVAFLALAATNVDALPVETCAEQSKCISWSVNVLQPSESLCFSSTNENPISCVVEVCLTMNPSYEECRKDCMKVSHMCDAADRHGCRYGTSENPIFDEGEYDGTCPLLIGQSAGHEVNDPDAAGSAKCEGVSEITFCQQGLPGEKVHFIIKDGSSTGGDNTFAGLYEGDGSSKCEPEISCRSDWKTCGNKRDGSKQQEMERVWTYTIPAAYSDDCAVATACDADPFAYKAPAIRDSTCAIPESTVPPTVSPTVVTVPPTVVTVSPTVVTAPPTKDPSVVGDPHFRTWNNEHFEYHGQCDMVLTKDETFANGLGMEIQIRSKLVRFWSYIKNAAIRIGDDILEVEGSADPIMSEGEVNYWLNFEHKGELKTLGGFPVTMILSDHYQSKVRFEIDLSSKYPDQKIIISTYKEFVAVHFKNSNKEAFGNTVGLLGQFGSGKTLARDGVTVMDNFMEFGSEWQVLPSEHMLFHDVEQPQFPQRCIEPEDPRGERRRRLEEQNITEEQAEAACASIKSALDRKDCVYDILATQDIGMVGAY